MINIARTNSPYMNSVKFKIFYSNGIFISINLLIYINIKFRIQLLLLKISLKIQNP